MDDAVVFQMWILHCMLGIVQMILGFRCGFCRACWEWCGCCRWRRPRCSTRRLWCTASLCSLSSLSPPASILSATRGAAGKGYILNSSSSSYSDFNVGSMYDDIRLHIARSYISSADSPFSLISSFTLSNHLLFGLILFLLH